MDANTLINCMICVGDIIGSNLTVSGSLVQVSHMDYTVYRAKNSAGRTSSHSFANMNLTLKLGEKSKARPFLEQMKSTDPSPFSIMAHPIVQNNVITDFRNAFVVWGYVTKAEEIFSSDADSSHDYSGGVLQISLDVNEINYLGDNSVKELHVFHG